jgi:hypothetical protein
MENTPIDIKFRLYGRILDQNQKKVDPKSPSYCTLDKIEWAKKLSQTTVLLKFSLFKRGVEYKGKN